MRRTIVLIISCAFIILAASTLFAQQVFFVQSVKAKVMAEPSFKSEVLAVIGKGAPVSVTGRQGRWVKVRTETTDGYLPSLILAAKPPLDRVGLIKGEGTSSIEHNVRRRASTYTSAAAARGLTEDDRRRISAEERANYSSLQRMESFVLSDEEVLKFSRGGKL